MVNSNALLLVFAVAFMGCVLATPAVTRLAFWTGAIDRPDQFRRIHKGATPRLGGLGLAFGMFVGIVIVMLGGYLDAWPGLARWCLDERPVLVASLIVLLLGFVDDTRGVGPRIKLLFQASAVMVLFLGGVRIESIDVLGWVLNFSRPAATVHILGWGGTFSLTSLLVTLLWFLGCMNIWNLIDGMDGLASGVGLLVSGTLTLVAIHHENPGVAITGAALAGSLAGFLLYNWHPACIFLGDSGSLLIGLLIGVIGVQGSFKATSSISLLFPILAMGLPITDTALAIFRRWVRNLPLSAADRRHVHHLLISLGLNPRQAALLLYCFSGFLCGAVLLGVALKNEQLALILGLSGCLAFLLILTSRLNELSSLTGDLQARLVRGRQERFAAKVTWEAIQRIELCTAPPDVCEIVERTTRTLGCDPLQITCTYEGAPVVEPEKGLLVPATPPAVSGSSAVFRLSSGQDLLLTVALQQNSGSPLAADIAFRFLQRLSLAAAERLERLLEVEPGEDEADPEPVIRGAAADVPPRAVPGEAGPPPGPGAVVGSSRSQLLPVLMLSGGLWLRSLVGWVRVVLGRPPRAVSRPPSLGEE
jgi:UDP-GlcNAc:undecaprenyl-phosphate/decaprenyl-phosphate GlcNAc-1-phosphate transferase